MSNGNSYIVELKGAADLEFSISKISFQANED